MINFASRASWVAAAAAVAFACAELHGQNPLPPGPVFVELDLLVIQIPESAAIPLIPRLRDSKQSAEAVESILVMLSKSKATLIAWPVLTVKSGQRSAVEQIHELRYATGYKPAEKSTITAKYPAEPDKPHHPLVSDDSKNAAPQVTAASKGVTVLKETDAIPSDFETRNLGVTFEAEPLIDQTLLISLSLACHHHSLLEMRRVEIEDKSADKKIVVEQPQILSNKVITELSVKDGDYTLLGTFKTTKPAGQIEFFILHTQLKTLR